MAPQGPCWENKVVQPVDDAARYARQFNQNIVRSVQATLRRMPEGDALLSEDQKTRALHVLDMSIKLPDAWPTVRELFLIMAPKMERAGHRADWLGYLEKGAKQADDMADRAAQANLLLQMGFLHQLQNNYDSASIHYQTSAAIFRTIEDTGNYARALNQQAFVAFLQRDLPEARRLTDRVIALLPPGDAKCATSYSVRGWLAFDNGEWSVAEENFRVALALWEQQEDGRQIARRLRDLGNALYPQHRFDEAIVVNERALALFEELEDRFEWAVTQMNLAVIHLVMKQPLPALHLLEEVEPIFVQVQDTHHLALLYHNWGIAHRDLHDFTAAEHRLTAAMQSYTALRRAASQVDALDDLGVTYVLAKRRADAIETFELALTKLSHMENDPSYQRIYNSVTSHLSEAQQIPSSAAE